MNINDFKVGDRVTSTHREGERGTVCFVTQSGVHVTWDTGGTYAYGPLTANYDVTLILINGLDEILRLVP